MKLKSVRKYYTHFITLVSLSGFMLLCFANCERVQLVPPEIEAQHIDPSAISF